MNSMVFTQPDDEAEVEEVAAEETIQEENAEEADETANEE